MFTCWTRIQVRLSRHNFEENGVKDKKYIENDYSHSKKGEISSDGVIVALKRKPRKEREGSKGLYNWIYF